MVRWAESPLNGWVQKAQWHKAHLGASGAQVECIYREFAGNAEGGGVVDTPNGCAAIQRELRRSKSWALRRISMEKYNVPLPVRNSCRHPDLLRADLQRRTQRSWCNTMLNKSQQLCRSPATSCSTSGEVLPADGGRGSFPSALRALCPDLGKRNLNTHWRESCKGPSRC